MTGSVLIDEAERQALATACQALDLDPADARLLHRHATAIIWLPSRQAVARITKGTSAIAQAERAVAMTRWLANHDYPATAPLDVAQPFEGEGCVVTFWRYYPQDGGARPSSSVLGDLLHDLHRLPPAPLDLPQYQPLRELLDTIAANSHLQPDTKRWLRDRCDDLLDAYRQLQFILPSGHIHGDAYPGNLLQDGTSYILGDWEETAVGPRELDLVNTFQGVRYGRTADDLEIFSNAYGYDLRDWRGFSTLRDIRDLHTLGAFMRRADRGDRIAARELVHRLETLRHGSTETWVSV